MTHYLAWSVFLGGVVGALSNPNIQSKWNECLETRSRFACGATATVASAMWPFGVAMNRIKNGPEAHRQ